MIEKYTDIKKLTVSMVNEYIEKFIVHEAIGGRKIRKENNKLMCTLIL